MSRVLYPFNYVPNGQIFDNEIQYSPCFLKRTTESVGTRTTRPIGLTLTDAMRLAWIVRSFKMDFINTQQQEIYIYSNNDAGYFPDVPPAFAPPEDEKFLVCCGFSRPDRSPDVWAETFYEFYDGSAFGQVSILGTRSWIADGYPTPQNPNPDFNPITDLTIYPVIVITLQSPGPTLGTNYVAATSGVSSSPKVNGVFLPKSAGFSKDYELDYYKGTLSSSFNAAPSFTFDNFWEYRDENGANPIWNKTTGARM